MSIDSVYIFVTCRLSFNSSHNYFIWSLKGKEEKTIYSNSLAGLFLDLLGWVGGKKLSCQVSDPFPPLDENLHHTRPFGRRVSSRLSDWALLGYAHTIPYSVHNGVVLVAGV